MNITLPLNKTIIQENREIYGGFFTIKSNSTIQVNLQNTSDERVSFIIFQVHSHIYNVTLYNNTYTRGSYIYGTNLGLYGPVIPALDTYFIINDNAKDLTLYITVHGYRKMGMSLPYITVFVKLCLFFF